MKAHGKSSLCALCSETKSAIAMTFFVNVCLRFAAKTVRFSSKATSTASLWGQIDLPLLLCTNPFVLLCSCYNTTRNVLLLLDHLLPHRTLQAGYASFNGLKHFFFYWLIHAVTKLSINILTMSNVGSTYQSSGKVSISIASWNSLGCCPLILYLFLRFMSLFSPLGP